MRPHSYAKGQHQLIEQLLEPSARPDVRVVVACNGEHPDQVFGWACCEPRSTRIIVHYVFTKQAFQRYGVGTALLKRVLPARLPSGAIVPVVLSHMTDLGQRIVEKNVQLKTEYSFSYSPYLAFYPDVAVQT